MPTELPAHLIEALDTLGYLEADGLISRTSPAEPGPRDYYWRELRDKVGLDAVFFNDGVPVVGFSSAEEPSGLLGVRKRLWNYGRVPFLINATSSEVSAYDAATVAPRSSGDGENGQVLSSSSRRKVASQLLRAFQRSEIEAGRVRIETAAPARRTGRVDRVLLRNLAVLKQRVAETNQGEFETIVGGCLTASYLRDRGILNSSHMALLTGMEQLDEVLWAGIDPTRRLFEGLTDRFNGDVFGAVPGSLDQVTREDLAGIAGMLRGDDLSSGQQSLWPYDFSVLPADLVSSVYEELLAGTRREDSAYYTPRFIVDLVLDEIIPWNVDIARFTPPKLADIACGSGAFMIEAFRRISYLSEAQRGRRLTYPELSDLMLERIFGVDQNPAAARVAAFGLYLSILEKVDPPDIWDDVRLPQMLGRNIVIADAFDDHELRTHRFDAVVSNPPWSSNLTVAARRYVQRSRVPISDQQSSQAFIWLARDMLQRGGRLGLILPAKATLHNRSSTAQEFRRTLFTQLDVSAIVDLSAVRRTVFSAAVAPGIAMIARLPADQIDAGASIDILHVAPHPRPTGSLVDALIVGPEDVHVVSRVEAINRPEVWKVLLWGSQRDLELIDRLNTYAWCASSCHVTSRTQ